MSQNQTFNNTVYPIPTQGDTRWAPPLTRYLAALGTYAISPAGGTYTLTADLNFGASFGLLAPYYKSSTANRASVGVLRLAHADSLAWRNNANSGDLALTVNASDQLFFNGSPFFSGSLTNGHILVGNASNLATDVALSGDVAITNAGASSVNSVQSGVITNAMVNNSAAIAYSKLSLTGSIQNSDIVAAAGIPYSKLTLTGSVLNADISTSAAIAYSKLAALTTGRALVSDGSGLVSVATTTATEIGFVNGVTSAIQTQLNTKAPSASPTFTGTAAALSSGATFGNTTSPSAATLDYYQEGTWTPADGSGAALSLTTTLATYTRIGRVVFIQCNLTYPATASGASSLISGLPFTVLSNSYGTGSLVTSASTAKAPLALFVTGSTTIQLDTAGPDARITNATLTGAFVIFTGFYITA